MTSEHMLLLRDSNKFLLNKSVTETPCNRLVNHLILKIYQILKHSPVSLTMIGFPETLRGGLRQEKVRG